jgi:hypothetical protein
MWTILWKTTIMNAIPRLVEEIHAFIIDEESNKKGGKRKASKRKTRDASLWTKTKVRVVRKAKKEFDTMNLYKKAANLKTVNQSVLIEELNAYLKLHKTRSCYARVWLEDKENSIDLNTLADGEPFYDNKIWFPT